MKVMSIDV